MLGGKPRKNNDHSDDEDNKPKRGCGTSKTPGIGVKGRNTGKVHAVVANYNNIIGEFKCTVFPIQMYKKV